MKRKLISFLLITGLLFFCSFSVGNAQDKVKVACVGNSITYGSGISHRDSLSYPAQLQRMMGDGYEVRNYGISGRTLLKKGDHPYWTEPEFEEVQQWNPDIVVIMLGTNDSKPQNWKYKDQFENDYEAFVETFKNLPSHPRIWVCLPVPVFKGNYGIRESVVKNEEPPIIKRVIRKERVKRLDLYKVLKPYGAHFPDGVHPDKTGASYMAKAVYKAIR